MSIDPKIIIWVKLITTVLNLVVNGTITLTGLVSTQTTAIVVAICQILITLLGAVLTAYSSSAPGPLAPPDSSVVQAATRLANLPENATVPAVIAAKNAVNSAVANHV